MAIVAKSFLHNDDKIVGASGDADGVLAEDIQDYITASGGTIDGTSNLNITCTKFGSKIFTLVVIDNNA
tara:strand:+ start:2535 stop:2741 length:207 start_codon:yes stop_codon:yes gene_type:complete